MDSIIIENDKIGQIKAKLLTHKNPNTVKAIINALPMDLNLGRWGEALFERKGLRIPAENTQIDCKVGDIGYWMQGDCIVIFFGKTPRSENDHPVAASAVNIFAKIIGDPLVFKQFKTFSGTLKAGD
ncbi:hypothetical protein LCGC14_2369900 [marine sediment metagenome]|uniref:Cyclophilin TM1367-like domain-containing protein n=1 Tax=marine sediment metagenome TaxID=412755 RepID=A0A0F9EGL0_9ZZZZ